jgi:hypothetical protein
LYSGKLGETSSFEEAYEENLWRHATEIGSKPIVELVTNSKIEANGSIKEY